MQNAGGGLTGSYVHPEGNREPLTGTFNESGGIGMTLTSRTISFTAQGEARLIDYVYPDNDGKLGFDYAGLSCIVQSNRVKTVQNCRSTPWMRSARSGTSTEARSGTSSRLTRPACPGGCSFCKRN